MRTSEPYGRPGVRFAAPRAELGEIDAFHTGLGRGSQSLHAILLAFPMALFPGALVTDITYLRTEEMQWANFSAWLIAGALAFNGLVLAWALVSLVLRFRTGEKLRSAIYVGLLAMLFLAGLINAFQHSRDAWSSVGGLGLTLSIFSTLLVLAAAIVAHTHVFSREVAR